LQFTVEISRQSQHPNRIQGDSMNRKQFSIALAFGLLAATQASAQQTGATVPDVPGLPTAARAAAASIDAEKIRAHVRFLSLDLLEGRGPGTRGRG
jgi:pectin methylesterase-like acyl-CoA thioesterase